MASPPRPRGINALEIVEHGFDRRVETVKVHAIKACLRTLVARSLVPVPQPFDELGGHRVSPHPRREASKVAQGSDGISILAATGDIEMHPKAIWPIRLANDRAEPMLFDESPS
jgi:hypothetical protein